MSVLLSHTTALEALRIWGLPPDRRRAELVTPDIPSELPGSRELASRREIDPFLCRLSLPLHLLASTGRGRRRSESMHAHLQRSPLPTGSILRLSEDVLCVSPEHLCVQMAARLTQLELIVLLSELLGLYAICPATEDGMLQRDVPIMTPDSLLEHLELLGPCHGVGKVRRALEMACVRSGSPRETKLSLRLALKPSLGGYHLNVLSMSESIEVRRIENRMRRGVRRPDILIAGPKIPGRQRKVVAVEYNGRRHDEPARLAQDAVRSNELKAIDIIEFIVRREQYSDLDYMDGLVALIREKLGMPRVSVDPAERRWRRCQRLRLYHELELIDGTNWNGLEREKAPATHETPAEEGDWNVVPVDAYGM